MKTILYILLLLTSIHTLYFGITGIIVFFKKKPKLREYTKLTKFCILVPARNESMVIKDLIESLKVQNYKKNMYDIIVLVNNSIDDTKKISLSSGAKVIDIKRSVKTKGEVLKYAIEALQDSNYDAYIIFDADNIVDKNFLKNMSKAYQNGYNVAQGKRDTKTIATNWLTTCYSLFYYIQNIFYNESRFKLNMSSSINGTGFMIDKKLMEKLFTPTTLTEDIELSIICNINNINIAYIDDAITYDEHPTNFIVSIYQRLRWSIGNINCFKKYRKDLLKKHSLVSIDRLLFIITPYIQVLSYILSFVFLKNNLLINIIFSTVTYLFTFIIYMMIIKYNRLSIRKNLPGILLFNIFIYSWIFINIVSIVKKDIEWKEVKHGTKKVHI